MATKGSSFIQKYGAKPAPASQGKQSIPPHVFVSTYGSGGGSSYSESAPEPKPTPASEFIATYGSTGGVAVSLLSKKDATSTTTPQKKDILKQGASNIFLGYTPVTTPLPYETRGTTTGKIEVPKTNGEAPFSLFSLITPNLREAKYKKDLTKLDYTQKLPYQQRGTYSKVTPTTEDLERLGFYEQAGQQEISLFGFKQQLSIDRISGETAKEISSRLNKEGEASINKFYTQLQNEVDSGKISVDKANKQLDDYVKNTNDRLQERFKSEHTNALTPIIKEANDTTKTEAERIAKQVTSAVDKRDAPAVFASAALVGTGLGIVSALALPVGATLMAAGAFESVAYAPETIAYAKTQPYSFSAGIVGGVAGGFAGAYIGRGLVISGNTRKLNNYLQNKNLKITDIKREYSFSAGKAVKVGADFTGKSIWEVQQKGITKFIDARTGRTIDTVVTRSTGRVVASSSAEATKSVVDNFAVSLRQNGWKLTKAGNSLTIKGIASKTTGEFVAKPVGESYAGYGSFDIRTGKFAGKVTPSKIKVSAELEPAPKYSGTSNFVAKMLGRYPEAKIFKGGKVTGIEEVWGTKMVSDISKNLIGKKPPKVEPLPVRDVSTAYMKVFTPKGVKFEGLDFSSTGKNIQQMLLGGSTKTAVKASQSAALQTQMSAVANDISKVLVGEAKGIAPPKLAPVTEIKTFPIVTTKPLQTNKQAINMQNLANVLGFESAIQKKVITPKPKSALAQQTFTGNKTTQVSVNKIASLLGGGQLIAQSSISAQKTAQATLQAAKLRQIQIQKPKIKTPNIAQFLIPKFPKSQGGYYYRKKPIKTKTPSRAYASSLAAYQLGITALKGYKTKQKFTGLEIRPLLYPKKQGFTKNYYKNLNRLLLGSPVKRRRKKK